MSKLRAIKERSNTNQVPHNDLRGLGDQNLFQKSSLAIHLIVRGKVDATTVADLEKAYGLKADGLRDGDFHFQSKQIVPGSHKSQALSIFFAAMEIARKHSDIAMFAYQSNGLAEMVKHGTSTPSAEQTSQIQHIAKWRPEGHGLWVDAAVVTYLRQVDVKVPGADFEPTKLTSDQLTQIHKNWVASVETVLERRKVG
jgi:hypothetical protein